MAIVLQNPLSLLFGATMPLLMLVPMIDASVVRRRARRDQVLQAQSRAQRTPGPAVLLADAESGLRTPPRQRAAGHDSARPQLVRLGVSQTPDELLEIDVRGGLEIIGPQALVDGVRRALEASVSWLHPSADQRVIAIGSGTRWLLTVGHDLRAKVIDRWGIEPPRDNVLVDILTVSEANRFASVVDSLARTLTPTQPDWDLFRDGPHALVSGVTGSGKTMFLRRWLNDLLAGPRELALVVIDFKGGGAFADFAYDHRVRHLVTNLDARSVTTALTGLVTLVEARQRVLANCAAMDIDDVDEQFRQPRVVVVVDEFRALIEQYPTALDLFSDIAARGRALGIHLILASQRFTAVAPLALTANCGLRFAFRAGDVEESTLMVGSAHAANPSLPTGRGFVSSPGRHVGEVQFSPTARHTPQPGPRHPLWLEPLIQVPDWTVIAAESSTAVLGVVDNHRALNRTPLHLDRCGLVLITGGSHHSRSAVVEALAEQLGVDPLSSCAVETWAHLGEPDESRGLILSECDAQQSELPIAWREEFAERVLAECRRVIAHDRLAVVSLASASGMTGRLRQLPHQLIELSESGASARLDGEIEFTPARPLGTVRTTPDSIPEPIRNFCSSTLDANVVLITPYPHKWSQRGHAHSVTPEDWIFGRVARDSQSRIFVDGLTPSEVRALRVSAECVPPPQPDTLLEVLDSGRWVRHRVHATELLDSQVDAR